MDHGYKKRLISIATAIILMIVATITFAQSNQQTHTNANGNGNGNGFNGQSFFNVEKANQSLNTINSKFVNKTMRLSELILAIDQLDDLSDQAKICAEKSAQQLKKINNLVETAKALDSTHTHQADYKYLQEKKLFYSKQLSMCRLFIYRSQEALQAYKGHIKKLSTLRLLKRGTPFWQLYEGNIFSTDQVDLSRLYFISGIDKLNVIQVLIGVALIVLGALIAYAIKKLLLSWLAKQKKTDARLFALMSILSLFVVPLTILSIISVFLILIYWNTVPNPSIELMSYYFLGFTVLFAVAKYFFDPPQGVPNPLELPADLARLFYKRFMALLIWVLLGHVVTLILREQNLSLALITFSRMLYFTVLSCLIVWFCWLFSQLPYWKKNSYLMVFLLKAGLTILLISMIATEWLGFHQLALFLARGVLLTVILLGVVIGLWQLTGILYQLAVNQNYVTARIIRHALGARSYTKLIEISLIKGICYFAIIVFLVLALTSIWTLSSSLLDQLMNGLLDGFSIGKLNIVPSRLIVALLSFAIVLLFGRFIATTFFKKRYVNRDEDTQVAMASLIIYIFFAVALLLALLIAGVSFTGLAIIGGALSFGVGLGLQHIVNNFASGLILLLEKPIKPGDRIFINGTEGFVKRIGIRSTQITTLAKEDVIVPNSDLITNQVTNFMFRNQHLRIICEVGVVYGSDIDLVKQVLLDVAAQHPDVMQEPPNAPFVVFNQFGDSSLAFHLWCILSDVNKKYVVTSELNFAINKAFKEHQITIAFPQLDVHIKNPQQS